MKMNRERRRGGGGIGDSDNDDDDRFELEDEKDQQLRDDDRLSKSKWRMTRRRSLSLLGSDDVDQYIVGGLERDFAIYAGARSRLSSSSSSKFHRFLIRPDNSVLLLLHAIRVRILQRTAGESFPPRRRQSDRFLYRHYRPFLRCLSRSSLLPPRLQSQSHCPQVLEITIFS
ncbi:hypothetical protein Dsin_004488 [Dipteronia sinensis]|uniref:Uncharacterized protein n=1 Tax=Dipteronia sinensis TaxID=43782 RepID=A0AAE0AUN9_9ROSI|nr:hypothetical protein Dsin_004488 [Dipteronia sinensis]